MPSPAGFETLLAEGLSVDVEERWGAGFLAGRYLPGRPSWTWPRIARPYVRDVQCFLDMGTGEGAELLTLAPLPPVTIAYEEWWPTVPAAAATLRPHGVHLVVCLGPDDNPASERIRPRLPFAAASFDAISSRHEAFDPYDIARLLRPGGRFVTQQVGGDEEVSVRALLELEPRTGPWTLDVARDELTAAGLTVLDEGEERIPGRFTDVGAFVAYLRSTPWSVPELDPVGMRERLRALHDRCVRDGGVDIVSHRFWVAARRSSLTDGRAKPHGSLDQDPRIGARVRGMTASSQPAEPTSHHDAEAELPRIRAALDAIPSYVPGKPPPSRPGLTTYKLSSNENPYPPLPGVVEAATRAAQRFNRYPDMGATALYAALAERFDVPEHDVAAGTGSVAILYHLLQATCAEGDEVVYAWRSFEAYPIAVPLTGATSVTVPVTPDGRHDLTAMAAAITDRTRVVIVCTPNNPTGPAVHRDELHAFLDRVPSRVLVVIDEAYREFVRDPDTVDAVDLYRGRDNVAVFRTFSKAYGLAGLRVGFAIAPRRIADAIRKAVLPFGLSQIAQDAAVASLAAEEALFERVEALVAERKRVLNGLREQGWSVPDSQANFVWLELGDRTVDFAAAGAEAGIMVRPFGDDGVRVTIGEVEANDVFLRVAEQWLAAH